MNAEQVLQLTPLGQEVWRRAHLEAAALYHAFLGTEHVLLALSRAEGGYTDRLLASLDRPAYLLRAQLRGRAGMGSPGRFDPGSFRLTPRLRAAMEAAVERAATSQLDERALLLAVLESGPGVAVRILAQDEAGAAALADQVRADPGPEATRLRRSGEDHPDQDEPPAPEREPAPPAAPGKTPLLDKYGRDLNREARAGRLKPIHGQRNVWLAIGQALARAERNVPVLVGEPGVGKTAIVEGLAERISRPGAPNYPAIFTGLRIVEVRTGELVAGTEHRGEFEQRLSGIIREAAAHREQIVLFIDEIHTLVGAGSANGSLDAAQMLKPALARGEIRVIGATTPAEFERYIARDAALARRMERVPVPEPTPEEAKDLVRAMQPWFESKYQVTLQPEALDAAVDLSVRYLPEQFLPGKALDLVDRACAQGVVGEQFSISDDGPPPVQGGGAVTTAEVRRVLAQQLGIPLSELADSDRERLARLERTLRRRVIGQDAALHAVTQALQISMAGLRDPRRPRAVLLLAGPTGVGKTETALAVAEALFPGNGGGALLRIDLNELHEEHDVARLVGAPPGYVGYHDEGRLTGWLRRHPFSVVLLDEIEKAHAQVFDHLMDLFDTGQITDGQGRTVMGREAVYILTTNLLAKEGASPDQPFKTTGFTSSRPLDAEKALRDLLRKTLRPELVGRLDRIVLYRTLSEADIVNIVQLQLDRLDARVRRLGGELVVTAAAKIKLAKSAQDPATGARAVAQVVERDVEAPLAQYQLQLPEGARVRVGVDVVDDHLVFAPLA